MIRTAESVTPMHPDKLCDRISDAILDEALRQDPNSRVAIETMGGHGIVTVTGEMTTEAFVDIPKVVRSIIGEKYGVQVNIARQSPEIAAGVDLGGAGDQGIMVGYACNETPELMPLEVMLARKLCQYIYDIHPGDGKTQVTVTEDGRIVSIVASFQNLPAEAIRRLVLEWFTLNELKSAGSMGDPDYFELLANPAGDWHIGGFDADTGLTGRKIAIDSYGPRIPIGGGAFSGKDGTKVDRSGAYMARQLAVEWLKYFEAKEVYVYLAYAIGKVAPVQATAVVDGKEMIINIELLRVGRLKGIAGKFAFGYDISPQGIIDDLDLRKPQFEETAQWGHFGNNFKWDR